MFFVFHRLLQSYFVEVSLMWKVKEYVTRYTYHTSLEGTPNHTKFVAEQSAVRGDHLQS